jgi:septum formation protein
MTEPVTPALLLASTSRYRAELLARLQIPFISIDPAVMEAPVRNETPESCAARLAEAKARAVASRYPGACVIGSDQVADWGGRVLGKPGSSERAVEQLLAFSGQQVMFHTAVCVIDALGNERGALDTTTVTFRTLQRAEIERYVEREQPLDCAGSFRSEGLGITLFERVRSEDPSALIGLPLIATAELLRQSGYRLP